MQVSNLRDRLLRELGDCANLYGYYGRQSFECLVEQWLELFKKRYDYPACDSDLAMLFRQWRERESRFPTAQAILSELAALRERWLAAHESAQTPKGRGDSAYWGRLCLLAFRGDERARKKLCKEE